MARRRPRYSPEFKAEAVRLARSSQQGLSTIAHDLGISIWSLRNWMEVPRPAAAEDLKPNERAELVQLRRRVRELEVERDILKKATAFFAKHSQ